MENDKFVWRLELTRSEHMALQSFLMDYMGKPDHLEVSIDVVANIETTPQELLRKLVVLQPSLNYASVDEVFKGLSYERQEEILKNAGDKLQAVKDRLAQDVIT